MIALEGNASMHNVKACIVQQLGAYVCGLALCSLRSNVSGHVFILIWPPLLVLHLVRLVFCCNFSCSSNEDKHAYQS